MTIYDSAFGLVSPGCVFLMGNPHYEPALWPHCGSALVEWRKLAEPAGEFNAVDHTGRPCRLADDDEVVMSRE